MPIYMDEHIIPGITAKDVAQAHQMDLLHEKEYGCKCMTYWIDEQREKAFCLIEAPDKDAVKGLHGKSHGLIPHKIIEVSSKVVQSFLGRIFDPEEAETTEDGLKVFSDSCFRILLVTKITDPALLQYELGAEKASELLQDLTVMVRKSVAKCSGTEVEHNGTGFIVSFKSAATAVSCALSIIENMLPEVADLIDLRIAVNAGEPVEKSNKMFGDAIKHAANMCAIRTRCRVVVTTAVKELVSKDYFQNKKQNFLVLAPQKETLLRLLFSKLEEHWQNPDFDIAVYCREMAMSTSRLYRETVALTGLSPNLLLKEFRLARAKELMKQKPYSISQITFDTGFTSPSYFTKCFKKKYGLLPITYLNMLH